MTTKVKRKLENKESAAVSKKPKKVTVSNEIKPNAPKESKNESNKTTKNPKALVDAKKKTFQKKTPLKGGLAKSKDATSKPPNWADFKKEKQKLRIKRKQSRSAYDVISELKQIGELLRRKNLKGGQEERAKLVEKAHKLLAGKGSYQKLVLTHDMARIVQYVLKFGTVQIRKEVANEIIPVTLEMLQSKYGKFCAKRLLKYGDSEIRASVIKAFYGNAVKLTSHAVSAPIFEYAYSTWASPKEKQQLVQEFFGDIYKQNKDDSVKHLSDVYEKSADMKKAVLNTTKSNLSRIMDKNLYDSGLVQTVLHQFLCECGTEEKAELIVQLAPHVVVLSNSKDGSRVVMQCIWHGSNKDRKVAMKSLKEHVLELSKHEYGHCSIIALFDSVDDTVLVNKIVLGELLKFAKELAADEWGRKVLLWLVAPAERQHFHPSFINELEAGCKSSTCKKAPEVRRKEILNYSIPTLLELVASETTFWLSTASIAVVTLAILKAGRGESLKKALDSLSAVVADSEWKIKAEEAEIAGIEHPGLHMILKKLAQHDKTKSEIGEPTFGASLLPCLTNEVLKFWIARNKGCFLLVALLENCTADVQTGLKEMLERLMKKIKKQDTAGANILIKKLT